VNDAEPMTTPPGSTMRADRILSTELGSLAAHAPWPSWRRKLPTVMRSPLEAVISQVTDPFKDPYCTVINIQPGEPPTVTTVPMSRVSDVSVAVALAT
jgi:hypothetical protein